MPRSELIRKDAEAVKHSTILIKGVSVLIAMLTVLAAMLYVVSYFYERYSSFTVSVDKYDMAQQGLSLSETEDFRSATSRLSAGAIKDCTNISGEDFPANIDTVSGDHSEDNYIAYTFFVKNTGADTVTYKYTMNVSNVTQNVDEAIRIRIYSNGKDSTYAKVKSDGSGDPEEGCISFRTQSIAAEEYRRDISPGEVDKYTVLIWLEGNDPDCVDSIIGGQLKADMSMDIVEGS